MNGSIWYQVVASKKEYNKFKNMDQDSFLGVVKRYMEIGSIRMLALGFLAYWNYCVDHEKSIPIEIYHFVKKRVEEGIIIDRDYCVGPEEVFDFVYRRWPTIKDREELAHIKILLRVPDRFKACANYLLCFHEIMEGSDYYLKRHCGHEVVYMEKIVNGRCVGLCLPTSFFSGKKKYKFNLKNSDVADFVKSINTL